MTGAQVELAKRAVACRGWRWMRGMNTTTGDTFIAFSDCDAAYWLALLPDLTDPATLGCLLALVRQVWSDPTLCVVLDTSDGRWHVGRWDDGMAMRGSGGTTEAEALVVALEAAP